MKREQTSKRNPITPMLPRASQYGIAPELVTKRLAEYPEMTSLLVKDLFSDTPAVIYPSETGIAAVRKAAEEALSRVDMSMIKPGQSVNVCASHHGFTLLGGEPYAELLRVVRDVIAERTGTQNIRLRAGVGLRFRETEEYIKRYHLDEHYKGKARGVAPIDEGVAIKTEIGTLYGIKAIYDADWIVHVHNSDVREVHFHRQVDRAVKPFGMSYARIETRSTYHWNMGPRGANFTARSIFDSEYVKNKFAFTAFLNMSPSGVVGVSAENNLYALNDQITVEGLQVLRQDHDPAGRDRRVHHGAGFSVSGAVRLCRRRDLRELHRRQPGPVRSGSAVAAVYVVHGGFLRQERQAASGRSSGEPGDQDGGSQLCVGRISQRILLRARADRGGGPEAGRAVQFRPAKPGLHEMGGGGEPAG